MREKFLKRPQELECYAGLASGILGNPMGWVLPTAVLNRSCIKKEKEWQRGGVLATLPVPRLLLEGRTQFSTSEIGTHPSTGH